MDHRSLKVRSIGFLRSTVFHSHSYTHILPTAKISVLTQSISLLILAQTWGQCGCVCVMLKWAGSDPYPSMELPGLGQIVRWSLTHLYNWGKPMPAAVQRTKFLEVSSWSEVAGQRAGVFGACSGVCGSPQNCSTCAAAELRLINYTLLMVSPWRLLFWWGSIDQITHTFVPHNAHTLTHTHTVTYILRRCMAVQDSPWLWSDTFLLSLGTCRGVWRVWFILHLGLGSCSSSPAGLWSISHQKYLCVFEAVL